MLETTKIRDDFPILDRKVNDNRLVYLDNAATTQVPESVLDETREFYLNKNSNVHRGVHKLSREAGSAYESARASVAEFIGAGSAEEIVFTRGTTEAINLVAECFGRAQLSSGDLVLTTEMDHHSNLLPWRRVCEHADAWFEVVPVTENGELDLVALENQLEKSPSLLALPYVSNVLGTVNPLEKIIRMAHDRDVPVLVDAAQAVQHQPVDVGELDCDFFAFSGHKMYANPGVGVLYGKRKWLNRLPPYQSGGGMVQSVDSEGADFEAPPHKFEAGTTNYGAAVGLEAAVDYISELGPREISEHEASLLDYALERLGELDRLTVYGRPSKRRGVVAFNFEDVHPYDAGEILDELGIAVRTGDHCAEPLVSSFGVSGMIRASLGLYNTEADIDRLISGLKEVRALLGGDQ